MIRRPPRSTQSRSSAASDVYKRQSFLFLKSCIRMSTTIIPCRLVLDKPSPNPQPSPPCWSSYTPGPEIRSWTSAPVRDGPRLFLLRLLEKMDLLKGLKGSLCSLSMAAEVYVRLISATL